MNSFDVVRTVLRAILPAPLVAFLDRLAEASLAKLQGETLRAIGYGAAGVLWAATRIADWLIPGRLPLVSIDVAMVFVTIAIGLVTEAARRWVYSPATVARIVATPPTAAGPINAAADAGVPAEAIAQELVSPTGDVAGAAEEIDDGPVLG